MRKSGKHLNRLRKKHPAWGKSPPNAMWGFFVDVVNGAELRIVASDGVVHGNDETSKWEHVSVWLVDRCPTWDEMCHVKNLFWSPMETVVQFHPSETHYVNNHPYCLHIWKKINQKFELPPEIAVGVKSAGLLS